jgi:hypothetical protein
MAAALSLPVRDLFDFRKEPAARDAGGRLLVRVRIKRKESQKKYEKIQNLGRSDRLDSCNFGPLSRTIGPKKKEAWIWI